MLELQQLRHLVAAVKYGNLLKASGECAISQSGLSRSIRGLEDRLGVPLLIRTSKGVGATIFGECVVRHAQVIVNEIGRTMDEIRAIKALDIGDVRFGMTQNFGHYLMPELLAALCERHPRLRFKVSTGGYLDLSEQLTLGAIDFAFGLLGPLQPDSGIRVELLREHNSRVIARREHPLAAPGREASTEELAAARWAVLSSEGFRRIFMQYFTDKGLPPPDPVIQADSLALIRRLIVTSDLVAVLPPDLVKSELLDGTLVVVDCDAPAEQTEIGFLFREGTPLTPQSRRIIDDIRIRIMGK